MVNARQVRGDVPVERWSATKGSGSAAKTGFLLQPIPVRRVGGIEFRQTRANDERRKRLGLGDRSGEFRAFEDDLEICQQDEYVDVDQLARLA